MKQPHDSKIGWQMVKRNLDRLTILTADKSYDWWFLHQKSRAEGVKIVRARTLFCQFRELVLKGEVRNINKVSTTPTSESRV